MEKNVIYGENYVICAMRQGANQSSGYAIIVWARDRDDYLW